MLKVLVILLMMTASPAFAQEQIEAGGVLDKMKGVVLYPMKKMFGPNFECLGPGTWAPGPDQPPECKW